jgi:NADH-quinone oxidoreductase subunit N
LATSIKRFIAYTAINQMGFLFMGLSVLTVDGLKSTIAYLYIYMLANVLFFAVVTTLQSKKLLAGDSSVRSLKDFALMKKDPISVGLMAVALLSLGGLPPLAGFFGKYALWSTVISHYLETPETVAAENLLYILITSVVVSLLSTFYYLRLIKMALFDSFSNVDVKAPGIITGNLVDTSLSSFFVVLLGVVTIGWAFMLSDLDMVWSRFTVALVSPFTSYTNPFDWS